MKMFRDSQGTDWQIDLNVNTLRRVQMLLGIDLTRPHEKPPATDQTLGERLVRDVMLLVDVVWAIVKPQAATAQIGDEQFAERLGGGALRAAKTALIEEWADFFRKLGQDEMAQAIQKTAELQTAIGNEALKQIERLSLAILAQTGPAMEREGDEVLAALTRTLSGGSSTNSLASSASIPVPSP